MNRPSLPNPIPPVGLIFPALASAVRKRPLLRHFRLLMTGLTLCLCLGALSANASATPGDSHTYSWTKNLISGWSNSADGLAFDPVTNNLIIGGFYTQSINFHPAGGTDNHTSSSFRDWFIWKMDGNATYNSGGWSRDGRGINADNTMSVNDGLSSVVVDGVGNIYAVGSQDTGSYPSGWGPTSFITKYNSTGTQLWGEFKFEVQQLMVVWCKHLDAEIIIPKT